MDPTLAAALAFPVALATVGLAVGAAPALGLIDVPGPRSSHARPVARSGGVGLLAALLAVGLPAALLGGGTAWLAYGLPAVLFFLVGLLDDLRDLAPRTKLALQVLAAAVAVLLGLGWEGTALAPWPALPLGAAAPWLSGLWLVAVVNLVNMLDGIDLITCALAAVVLALAAGHGAGPGDGALYAAAAGATLGLACWNATPARVFPGDAGTHLLGFLVGATALGRGGEVPTAALPWVLASAPLVPGVIDVVWGLASKRRLGLPWWSAHRESLYHRLTKDGWSHAAVALRYGALALAAAFLVGRVAPRWGLPTTLGLAGLVLGAHVVHGLAVARRTAPPRVSR